MSKYSHKPLHIILLILFIGCILGSALSTFIAVIIPEEFLAGTVVRNFFTQKITLGFDETEFNLDVIKFILGFKFDVSILSIFGMLISWYFLRYFK